MNFTGSVFCKQEVFWQCEISIGKERKKWTGSEILCISVGKEGRSKQEVWDICKKRLREVDMSEGCLKEKMERSDQESRNICRKKESCRQEEREIQIRKEAYSYRK
jgi:hypothetical protein